MLELTWSATPSGADSESRPRGHSITDGLLTDTNQVADDNESIAYPGETDLRYMTQLVETGQITAIKEWATGLKLRDPCYIGFADLVITAAQRLAMEDLRMLAERGQVKKGV